MPAQCAGDYLLCAHNALPYLHARTDAFSEAGDSDARGQSRGDERSIDGIKARSDAFCVRQSLASQRGRAPKSASSMLRAL